MLWKHTHTHFLNLCLALYTMCQGQEQQHAVIGARSLVVDGGVQRYQTVMPESYQNYVFPIKVPEFLLEADRTSLRLPVSKCLVWIK